MPGEAPELLEEKRRRDNGRPRIEGEAVAFPHIGASARPVAATEVGGGLTVRPGATLGGGVDVGLQQVSDDQDSATVVVFGQYVVESVNSGTQEPPPGSECTVTPEGAQSCTQTVQLQLVDVDGTWKISELTLLTTS